MNGEFLAQAIHQIIIIIVFLSILSLLVPLIAKIIIKRKGYCECGQKIRPEDKFCPNCGKKVR